MPLGNKEQTAFDELKKGLANAVTQGYYDKNAKSQVIIDASPVGVGAVLIVYITSPGRPTDIALQFGKACYHCSR